MGLFIICVGVLIFGNQSYQNKISSTVAEASKASKALEEQEKKEEARQKQLREQEEKKTYEKHKGEELIYFPMGDSLAEGFYASTDDKKYVSVFSDLIESKLGYDVKTKEGAAKAGKGLRDLGLPKADMVMSENPDLITIEFGNNDADVNKTNTYSSPEEFKDRLEELIDKLLSNQEKTPQIIIVTTWNNNRLSDEYDAIIKEVGEDKDIPIADIRKVWLNRTDTYGPEGQETYKGLSDLAHPNDKGHGEIAKVIFDTAYDLLK